MRGPQEAAQSAGWRSSSDDGDKVHDSVAAGHHAAVHAGPVHEQRTSTTRAFRATWSEDHVDARPQRVGVDAVRAVMDQQVRMGAPARARVPSPSGEMRERPSSRSAGLARRFIAPTLVQLLCQRRSCLSESVQAAKCPDARVTPALLFVFETRRFASRRPRLTGSSPRVSPECLD